MMEYLRCSSKPGKLEDWDVTLNGAPASNLSPGRRDRPAYEGKGLMGIWRKNGRTCVPKFLGPRDGSTPEIPPAIENSRPQDLKSAIKTNKKQVVGYVFLIFSYFRGRQGLKCMWADPHGLGDLDPSLFGLHKQNPNTYLSEISIDLLPRPRLKKHN